VLVAMEESWPGPVFTQTTPVLSENLIRLVRVDVSASCTGPWSHDFMAHPVPLRTHWHGSISRIPGG